jgi:hypothetical protein
MQIEPITGQKDVLGSGQKDKDQSLIKDQSLNDEKSQVSTLGSKIADLSDTEDESARDHYYLQFWNDDKPDSILKFADQYGDDDKHVGDHKRSWEEEDIDKWHHWNIPKSDHHKLSWNDKYDNDLVSRDSMLDKPFGRGDMYTRHNKFKKDDIKPFGDKESYRKTKFPFFKHKDDADDQEKIHSKQSLLTIKFQTEPEVHGNSFLKVSFGDDESSLLGHGQSEDWGHTRNEEGWSDVSTKDDIKTTDARAHIVPKVQPTEGSQVTKQPTDNATVTDEQQVQQGNVSGSLEGQETAPSRPLEIAPASEESSDITQGTTQGTQGSVPPS